MNHYQQPPKWFWWAILCLAAIPCAWILLLISQAISETSWEMLDHAGGFYGGILGPLFGGFSFLAVLTTLYYQNRHNHRERIDNKFYQLLNVHIQNVNSMKIKDVYQGREIFVRIIKEFRIIHRAICDQLSDEEFLQYGKDFHELDSLFKKKIKLIVSSYILFYGVGKNSDRMIKNYLVQDDFLETISPKIISEIIKSIEVSITNGVWAESKKQLKENKSCYKDQETGYELKYVVADGHQSRFGHYYRHLFQLVKFIDSEKIDLEQKSKYIKTVRAQLSNHEQALLFINSITNLGRDWWASDKSFEDCFMVKYGLISNIPKDFFNPDYEFDLFRFSVNKNRLPRDYFEFNQGGDDKLDFEF